MIPRTGKNCQTVSWNEALATAFTCPEMLIDHLKLDRSLLPAAQKAASQFGLRVPFSYVAQMEKGNPRDPLLLQVLPLGAELLHQPGFITDPVGDFNATACSGLLHKYHGRALMITTGICAINCRYCFRRHFPYQESSAHLDHWAAAIRYLKEDTSINEIILSGGEPLMLTDPKLAKLILTLEAIPHLLRLRIHTRMPVIIPQRITDNLLDMLENTHLQSIIVIHSNHPNELSPEVQQALRQLRSRNVTLLNQSVLLKGINNNLETQIELCESLFRTGTLPYYLHMLDPVQGAAHFEVSQEEAITLHQGLLRKLPGYLVPRLVRELSGSPAKTPVHHSSESLATP